MEVTDCVVVEAVEVLEADSGVDVVDVATVGVDEGVEVLEEEDCVRSVGVEEDAVLEVDPDVVEEDVTSEDVDVDVEDESAVWAEEKWTNERPSTANSTIPPKIPMRNELCFISVLLVYWLATCYLYVTYFHILKIHATHCGFSSSVL